MISLDRFDAILIDMNGTFMFGQDSFGPLEDYNDTYLEAGGHALGPGEVRRVIDAAVAAMDTLYRNPAHAEAFPSISSILGTLPATRGLPPCERNLIEAVIAAHERGHVPEAHAVALRHLSTLYPLVLVSNSWSAAAPWRAALVREGLLDLFAAAVFSSEHDCIKPSPRLYAIARDIVDVPFERILSIGDDPILDIAVPRRLGMLTAQVGPLPSAGADLKAAGLPEFVER